MRSVYGKLGVVLTLGGAFMLSVGSVSAEDATPKLNVGGVATGGGTIKGVVKFDGKEAKRKQISVTQDANCVAAHTSKPLLEEKYVFGDGGTLQNVFVYVSKGLDGKSYPLPTNKPELNQMGCAYVPHVMGVVKGQEIIIKNDDQTTHNVHLISNQKSDFNKPTGPGVMETLRLTKDEMATNFKCDIHPWMSAYVHVMDNPFFAVTQQDGTFEIRGLPAGHYELSFWHEFARFAPDKEHLAVDVEDGKTAEVTVTYALKK